MTLSATRFDKFCHFRRAQDFVKTPVQHARLAGQTPLERSAIVSLHAIVPSLFVQKQQAGHVVMLRGIADKGVQLCQQAA
jgi:hypothetical protein